MNVIVTTIQGMIDVVLLAWNTWGDEIMDTIAIAWDYISTTVETAIEFVSSIIETVLAIINGDWGDAWEGIKDALGAVWDQIVNLVSTGGELLKTALEGVLSALRLIWDAAWQGMKDVLGGLWDGFLDTGRWILNAMIGALESLVNTAIDGLNLVLDGIDKAAGPWVNFDSIPEVKFGRIGESGSSNGPDHLTGARADGGMVRRGGTYLIGERGPELLHLGDMGGMVFPNDVLRSLVALEEQSGSAPLFAEGAVKVDARGIRDPETVGDYAARSIGWRITTTGTR